MSDEQPLSPEHVFLNRVALAFRSGDFDGAVDLSVRYWGGVQGSPEDRAAYAFWLPAMLQGVAGLPPADAFEVGFVVAQRLNALRAFARTLAEFGKEMKPYLDAGATVDEATAAVLQPQPVTRH
ncbi:MAG: hypothetical protein MUF10_10775 [Thermoanaerobaculaceae bacterium]|jgi:hypothetical protein|nr:hypothetical protein [Thermoanaerobaculaceae bacterium]